MCDSITRDAQEIKKRLSLLGQKDIDESTICELLRSFGSDYELNSVTNMIIGTNDTNDSGFDGTSAKAGPSNATNIKSEKSENKLIKDGMDIEESNAKEICIDINSSESDLEDNSYYGTASCEETSPDSTPQSSPPLLATIELCGNTSTPVVNSNNAMVDVEILEENNNDPNNNLDSIQILQEQRGYGTGSNDEVHEVESTGTSSPKPGCSKDFNDAEPSNVHHKLREEALQICNLLPRFKYIAVYRALQRNCYAKNRVELSLWDLLPHKRPMVQFPSKRKLVDDNCIIECKKTPTVVKKECSEEIDDSSMPQNCEQPVTMKEVGDAKQPSVLQSENAEINSSYKDDVLIKNEELSDVYNTCDSSCTEESVPHKSSESDKVPLNSSENVKVYATHPNQILRPAKLIVKNNEQPCASNVVSSSSPILAPPKLIYVAPAQHKDQINIQAPPNFRKHRKKTESSTNKSSTYVLQQNVMNPFQSQSMDNYMQYLQFMKNSKKQRLSGKLEFNNFKVRDELNNLVHSGVIKPGSSISLIKADVQRSSTSTSKASVTANTGLINNEHPILQPTKQNFVSNEHKRFADIVTDGSNSVRADTTVITSNDPSRHTASSSTAAAVKCILASQAASSSAAAVQCSNLVFQAASSTAATVKCNYLSSQAASSSAAAVKSTDLLCQAASSSTATSKSIDLSSQAASSSIAPLKSTDLSTQIVSNSAASLKSNDILPQAESSSVAPLKSADLSSQVATSSAAALKFNDMLSQALSNAPTLNSNVPLPQTATTGMATISYDIPSCHVPSISTTKMSFTVPLSHVQSTSKIKMNYTDPLCHVASNIVVTTSNDSSPSTASGSEADMQQQPTVVKKEDVLPPEILQTYNKLMSMFPHVDRSYLKELCQSYFKDDRYANPTERLQVLIDYLLQHGDSHLAVVDVEQMYRDQTYDVNERYAYLSGIFPDADPLYLREVVKGIYNDPDAMIKYIQSQWENPDYPTKEQKLERIKITEQQKQYTANFDVPQFLEIFPDPFAHFSNPQRKCKFDAEAFDFLKHRFNRIKVNTIMAEYSRQKHNLTLTAEALEKMQPDMKSKRFVSLLPTENIPLLQEFAFINKKTKIKQYLDEQKAKEAEQFQELKRKNELLECQCCYDNECMPLKCSTCDDGHIFCNACIIRGTESRLAQGDTRIPCFANCNGEFSLSTLQRLLPPTQFSILLHKRQEAEVMAAGVEGLVSCPFCHFASIPPPEDKVFKCLNPECMKESCRECKELNHVPFKCDEVKSDRARLLLEEKMTEALVRSCHCCGKPYFKEDGCNKILCTCGALMCYICDKPIKGYGHFNGQGSTKMNLCPLWSDNHRINAETVRKVAEETVKHIAKTDPNVKLNTQGLIPHVPPPTSGPHQDVPNANVIPERANRIARFDP